MNSDEDDFDETIVVAPPWARIDDPADDETIVVGPRPDSTGTDDPADDETIVVGPRPDDDIDDPADDETIVVGPRPNGAADPADDETIVVARPAAPAAESTDPEADDTVVVARRADEPEDLDETVVVAQQAVAARDELKSPPEVLRRPRPRASNRAQRTRIVLPEGQALSERAADGAGVGAVDTYQPRQVPPPPAAALAAPDGDDRGRRDAPGMPSVARASRRSSSVVIVGALIACVITVAGLVLIARFVFGG